MRVLPRHALDGWLGRLGIDRATLTWPESETVSRLLIREPADEVVDEGPHRRIALPGEDSALRLRLGDRPRLSGLVAEILADAEEVCAVTRPGTYWLNNRGYAAYLARVPDAQRIHDLLRRVGLTNRFRGGFLIRPYEFATRVPLLAAQPFCGGPDVFFVARGLPLIVMACHEFDLHVETRDPALIERARALTESRGLIARGTEIAA